MLVPGQDGLRFRVTQRLPVNIPQIRNFCKIKKTPFEDFIDDQFAFLKRTAHEVGAAIGAPFAALNRPARIGSILILKCLDLFELSFFYLCVGFTEELPFLADLPGVGEAACQFKGIQVSFQWRLLSFPCATAALFLPAAAWARPVSAGSHPKVFPVKAGRYSFLN